MTKKTAKKIDLNLFESIIAYHALFNAEYLASIIDFLKPDLFNRAETKAAIFPIVEYFNEHNEIPTITEIKVRLQNSTDRELFAKLLREFQTIDKTFNLKELLTNTEQFLKERSLVSFLSKTATQLAKEGSVDYEGAYAELESAVTMSLIDDVGLEYFKDFDKHLEYLDKKESRLSTGWKWLDEKLGGGLLEEGRSLYVFCGTTNVGKSIFLGNIANNIVKQGKCAVIITLEMPEQIYAKRISSQLTRIPINTLAEQKEHLRSWMNNYTSNNLDSKLFIKEFPPSSISANHIRAYLTKLVRKGVKIDAIIIDYLNLMIPCRGSGDGNSYEKIKKIAEETRALSYVFNAPVISATQLNRSAYDQANPGLETTGESMGLPMTADAQFGIWCTDEDREAGILHLNLMKNRFGPNFGNTTFQIDYDTLHLSEYDNETLASDTQMSEEDLDSVINDLKLTNG
jgi:replicative DNA helicase